MNDATAQQRQARAAGLVLVLVWGSSFTIQKVAYAVDGACRLPVLPFAGDAAVRAGPAALARQRRLLCGITLASPVLHIVLVTYGIHWSTPFSSALIMACGPVCTLVLLRWLRGTRLQLRPAWAWRWQACCCSWPTSWRRPTCGRAAAT